MQTKNLPENLIIARPSICTQGEFTRNTLSLVLTSTECCMGVCVNQGKIATEQITAAIQSSQFSETTKVTFAFFFAWLWCEAKETRRIQICLAIVV